MRPKNLGFTFLEVIIALAIVSIAVVALVRMHIISINMTEKSNLNTRAVLLAQQKMAETLAQGYPQTRIVSGSVPQGEREFHWQTEVRNFQLPQYNRNDIAELRHVCVEVNWTSGSANKHLRMTTFVAKRELP